MFKFFERINLLNIVLKHFGTLYNAQNDKPNIYSEIIPLLVLPWLLGYFLVYQLDIIIDKNISTYLFGGYSVAGGFLINALMVLADKYHHTKNQTPNDEQECILKETFYNTSFGVLICLLSVILSSIYALIQSDLLSQIFSVLIYGLSFLFIHTLLMVIKRLNKVFDS